jgi:hypothetical protein
MRERSAREGAEQEQVSMSAKMEALALLDLPYQGLLRNPGGGERGRVGRLSRQVDVHLDAWHGLAIW